MSPAPRVVSDAELNRATLARQLLLERVPLDPVTAIRRLCALQAQEPASPYIALWTRLADFQPADLDAAFRTSAIVKATLMRVTLHAVAAEDYPACWAAYADYIRAARTSPPRFPAGSVPKERLDDLVAHAVAFATEPRSNAEMAAHLEEIAGPFGDQGWWWAVRPFTPVLRAAGDEPWSFAIRPSYVAPATAASAIDRDEALDYVVRSYLAAFGPASVLDIAQFLKVARAPVRRSVERLATGLDAVEAVTGQTLYDVPGGPIPAGDVPAPVRLLPMWDSVLMAYADRARIIPANVRKHIIRQNGDVLPTFLVDGHVAGIWRTDTATGQTVINAKAFHPLPDGVWHELAGEAQRLAVFVHPREPGVYRRYHRWWDLVPAAEVRTLTG